MNGKRVPQKVIEHGQKTVIEKPSGKVITGL